MIRRLFTWWELRRPLTTREKVEALSSEIDRLTRRIRSVEHAVYADERAAETALAPLFKGDLAMTPERIADALEAFRRQQKEPKT
ncbi:hypothetical protein [Maritimibacter sp. DP1N21-5]|uniref:hypothetical protein n=1 Tax=Maritimibacter sp. DP1N21-5 TaxID=2836867 RepID=UPI001C4755A6|nr:hypothetical protein [Maritimibacter sp. DP1N21-5]MBV7408733.1 hypothetical protein [Maritimibacter sp. DP1N21-5]